MTNSILGLGLSCDASEAALTEDVTARQNVRRQQVAGAVLLAADLVLQTICWHLLRQVRAGRSYQYDRLLCIPRRQHSTSDYTRVVTSLPSQHLLETLG